MWLEAEKARNFNAVVWVLGEVNGYHYVDLFFNLLSDKSTDRRADITHSVMAVLRKDFIGFTRLPWGLGLFGPLFLFAKTRQRRTGQGVERALATTATVTRQPTRATPPLKPPPAAVRTTHTLNPLLRCRDHQGQSGRRRRRHLSRCL